MVRLIAPSGSQVNVPEEKAERLVLSGYRRPSAGDTSKGSKKHKADGEQKGKEPGGDPAGTAPDGAPKGNASRDEWAAHADRLGVQYAEDAKRDDIKAAVEAAASND